MYLDPGFGGMLVQVIVAIVATGGVAIFALRKKIAKFFSKKKNNVQNTSNNANSKTNNPDDVVDMMNDKK